MTVSDLIQTVLSVVRNQFYADRAREFKRDERALTKALARYGYECQQRAWPFEAEQIQWALLDLLNEIKRSGADIGYFPIYLEGAVDRHVRQRAEELNAKAKSLRNQVAKALQGVRTAPEIQERSATETLGLLYRDLKRGRRRKRTAAVKQESLL